MVTKAFLRRTTRFFGGRGKMGKVKMLFILYIFIFKFYAVIYLRNQIISFTNSFEVKVKTLISAVS